MTDLCSVEGGVGEGVEGGVDIVEDREWERWWFNARYSVSGCKRWMKEMVR